MPNFEFDITFRGSAHVCKDWPNRVYKIQKCIFTSVLEIRIKTRKNRGSEDESNVDGGNGDVNFNN